MLKKSLKFSIIAIFLACSNLYALDPGKMLENGIGAFELAKWEESREILSRFMELWPEHENYSKALYYHTLASARTIDSRTEEYRASLGNQLINAVASLSKNLPDKDIGEAIAAIQIAQNPKSPKTWQILENLKPTELKHYLSRKWHPVPSDCPFETLRWANAWLDKNSNIDSELFSEVSILKLKAMWQILISPMVRESSNEELETLGCLPLDKIFRQTLNLAFRKGNTNQKRIVSLLGYHFDYFQNNRLNTNKSVNSFWLRYLNSRGISPNEAWSPK